MPGETKTIENGLDKVVFSDFRKASLRQLQVILRHENCELVYKCIAQSELERRLEQKGMPINFEIWNKKAV